MGLGRKQNSVISVFDVITVQEFTTCRVVVVAEASCSVFKTRGSCETGCGSGTNVTCSWRDNNPSDDNKWPPTYATCSPDVRTCPDDVCDELEQEDAMLCPQDCTRELKRLRAQLNCLSRDLVSPVFLALNIRPT